jgi:hypothetical protein
MEMRIALGTNRLTDLFQGDAALAAFLGTCDEVRIPFVVKRPGTLGLGKDKDPAIQPELVPLLGDGKEGVRLRAAAYLRLSAIHAKAPQKTAAQ